jgi:D-3-phosphoglycerate dehydrogenase
MISKILISDQLHPDAIAWLTGQLDVQVRVQPQMAHEELVKAIADYDALIVRSRTKVTEEVIIAGKRLKVIGRAGTGLDNIDIEAARRAQIQVLNAPGANANAVAELTVGFMIALARDLPQAMSAVSTGTKVKGYGTELADKTLGLIGYGRIGRVVAHLALAFGMNVLAYDIITPERPEPGVHLVSLKELVRGSDFVSLHIPLTPDTRGFISTEILEQFKAGSVLINTARAELVDERAVLAALHSGKLKKYAADLYAEKSPFIGHPQVLLTPHIGASTHEAQRRAGLEIAEKVWQALTK